MPALLCDRDRLIARKRAPGLGRFEAWTNVLHEKAIDVFIQHRKAYVPAGHQPGLALTWV
jgi:hypothetical protein